VRDPRYLRPQSGAAHFLWDDLYGSLGQGRHELCGWLREGFFQLGLTPPDSNVGPLWPDEDEAARKNQRDFAKLWRRTRTRFEPEWRIETGSRCQLYLTPKRPSLAAMVLLSPLAQRGNLLMVRVHAADDSIAKVHARLRKVAERLPVRADSSQGRAQNGRPYVDLPAPLSLVLRAGRGCHRARGPAARACRPGMTKDRGAGGCAPVLLAPPERGAGAVTRSRGRSAARPGPQAEGWAGAAAGDACRGRPGRSAPGRHRARAPGRAWP